MAETRPVYRYRVTEKTYRGHQHLITPPPTEPGKPAPPVEEVTINRVYEPGDTFTTCQYAGCKQCQHPPVSRALAPLDEETQRAMEAEKARLEANRRARAGSDDPALLRGRLAELEAELAKRKVAELEQRLADKSPRR